MIRIATSLAILAFGVGSALAQNAPAPAGDAAHGKELFLRDGCWQCHGLVGQGAGATGPRISRVGLPFEGFLHQLREPLSDMAPYEAAILPDDQAADIYAFLKSLPPPPAVKDTPLLAGMGVR